MQTIRFALLLLALADLVPWFEGEGFGGLVTHHVPIGDFDRPHPFFGPDGKPL